MALRSRFTSALLGFVALAACLALPSGAAASSRQVTVMQDDGLLLKSSDAVREATLDEFAALGTDVVKVQVYWNELAPSGRKKPSFDATDPAAYNWAAYDAVVSGTVARGMRPYLVLGNRAPDWARKKRSRHNGTYRPSARELELFSQAAGTRYSGSYGGLPRVDIWAVWNEPNLSSWLGPQRNKSGVPLSPSIYRNLYVASRRGLVATGHGSDTILLGELMPLGQTSPTKVPPLQFLREMACVDRRYRRYRGRAARARGCPTKRVGRIRTSGIAYHPYTSRGGPSVRPLSEEASIGTLSRIARVTDRLARRGLISRRLPVWVSEYGFQTNPPDPFQYPIRRVPGFMDESEWFAFRNRRVASYSHYTLKDDKPNPTRGLSRYAGFQQGLRFANGRAKPGVYEAFRMPAFVRLLSSGHVEVFGGLRTAAPGAEVVISSRRRKGRYRVLRRTSVNSAGYFRVVVGASGASRRTYKITIGGRSRIKHAARR